MLKYKNKEADIDSSDYAVDFSGAAVNESLTIGRSLSIGSTLSHNFELHLHDSPDDVNNPGGAGNEAGGTWIWLTNDFSGKAAGNGAFIGLAPAGGTTFFDYTTGGMTFWTSGVQRLAIAGTGNVSISTGGSANHAICWKNDGKTLGYCSTQPDESGVCTCN